MMITCTFVLMHNNTGRLHKHAKKLSPQ